MKPLRKAAIMIVFLILSGAIPAGLQMESIEAYRLDWSLHPGMDAFGRNCLTLTLAAISNTLASIFPILGFILALSIGVALLASGESGPMRFLIRSTLDLFSALPGLLLALSLGVVFPDGNFTVYLATFLMILPSTVRYFESFLLKIRSEEFILASNSMGAPPFHIWIYHLIPALRDSILTLLPFVTLRLILIETSISFLGLTPAPDHETWGRLLAQGKDYLLEAPWIMLSAAVPLCLLLASFHLLSHEEKN
ncbi:MAG: ABC transporter permease subunit [Bdellovibrionales bacterium]|nr:ABC transporter permease subunit [Bdellovibrionales bacterium]